MGKDRRNGRSRYRIVVHSAEYIKSKRAFEARKKALRDKEIFTGAIILPPLINGGIVSKEIAKKLRLDQIHDNEVITK